MEKGSRGRLAGTCSLREMYVQRCAFVHGGEEGRATAVSDSHSHLLRSLKYHWPGGVGRSAITDCLRYKAK